MEHADEMRMLREKIDRLDRRIVRLLNKRATYADQLGKIKERLGLPVYSPEREEQVIENVCRENPGPLTGEAVKRVYERIIDESRRLERESAEERRTSLQSNGPRDFFQSDTSLFVRFGLGDRRTLVILLLCVVAVIFLVLCGIFFLPYHHAKPAGVIITIDHGMTASKVFSELTEERIISGKFLFRVAARILSVDEKIKAGKYLVRGYYSDYDVLKLISLGKSNLLVTVTIPEGLTVKQIASIYHRELGADSVEFVREALGDSAASALGIHSKSLEGYLFPQSYDFYYGAEPNEIIERMVDEFKLFFNDTLQARAKEMGLSVSEVMKVASIIEDEAKVDSERAIIASVYYNRLKKHIPLEADPTIQYALGKRKRIYYKDLRIDSPYNSYERIGLPPTPICNPGEKSIIAALYPAKTKYLFFVATGTGGHRFSETYSQHLRAVRAYRRARASN
jgi:UPF0755 protein